LPNLSPCTPLTRIEQVEAHDRAADRDEGDNRSITLSSDSQLGIVSDIVLADR